VPDTSEAGFVKSRSINGRNGKWHFAPVKGFLTVLMALALMLGTVTTVIASLATATPAGASGLPTVTSLTPNTGQIAGGTSVIIAGTNFTSPATVDFGSSPATSVVVNNSGQITATSPAGSLSAITVDVTVTDAGGTSTTSPADQFMYAVEQQEDCYATTSEGNQSATNTAQFVAQSNPTSVLPGGQFSLTYSDPGNNSVPSSSGGYGISGITNTVDKINVPANTTVVSGPTVTSEGYYYAPPSGAHTDMPATVTLINDAATPAGPTNHQNNGQEVEISIPENIPGGDNYVMPTVSLTVQLSASPNMSNVYSGTLDVQPVGTAVTSTDPGTSFIITVTGTPVGSVAANTACWPFPSPQPPFVSTNVIDAVPPAITIASPGDATQVVQNAHVAAAFGCTDTPAWGNGIASCTATNDGSALAVGQLINTSTLGPHTVVVSASNNSGTTNTATAHYTVIAPPYNLVPPTVTITAPQNGAQYITGSIVNASYSCTANAGTTTCNGSVPSGSAISTTAGYHTFTVSAVDTRGNPTTVTVGYYARTSNTQSSTSTHQTIGASYSASNTSCSLGNTYYTITLSTSTSSKTCNSGTAAEIDTKVTAPAANGGQLAVGDTITVDQQIYKPGYNATAANGGYYTGAYGMNFTLAAPAGTAINGPITSSPVGLPSTSFASVGTGVGNASAASACNYGANATTGTGACSATPAGPQASTTSSAAGATTVGAFGSATNANIGSATAATPASTTVGAYGSTTVHTLGATTVAAASNGQSVSALTGSTLNVAAITGFPTATGNRLEVATTGGVSPAVLAYTGTATGKFNGITVISGSGTVATGAVVQQPHNVANMNNLPITAATGLRTTGTNQITVTTDAGTATLQYTSEGTTAANCGTQPCFLGISVVSGSGNVTAGNSIFQAPFAGTGILPATSVTGFSTTGSLNVTLGGNPAVVAYTGTSTTAATCGAAACFTGVTLTSGSGTATAGSAISSIPPDVSTFAGSGVIPATTTIAGFPPSGTITAGTSNGAATFTYTGIGTTAAVCGTTGCFTGVTTQGGATGTLTAAGAITFVQPNISTFTGSGVIPATTTVTGFPTAGTITAATSNGTATFTYTGIGTTAAVCGTTGCFTGVTTQGGATGTLTPAGGINRLNDITTYTGAGVLPVAAVTGFTSSGSVTAATSNGPANFTYTGTGTTTAVCGAAACFTGVTTQGGATGTLTAGGAVTQAATVVTSLSNGTLSVAASTNFAAPGLVSVATSGGTAYVSFSGTGTGTLTGATYEGGAGGTITGGGAVTQANGLTQNLDAFGRVALTTNNVDISTLTGSGSIDLVSATATPWTAPGNVEVNTSNGVQTLSFTGISGNTLTGVSDANGGTGIIYGGALAGQAAPTSTYGASSVNGATVSGYNWSVPANNQSTVNVTWDDSSCVNPAGQPNPSYTSTSGLPCNNQEQFGMDGTYVYLQYELTVTSSGTITIPGLPATNSTTNNNQYTSSVDSGTIWGSNPFITTATAAPGISWTAVDPVPPVATLNAPIQGAVYANGQVVNAAYSCSEPTSGVTITSCTGVEDAGTTSQLNIANGSPLNTSELIKNQIHTFTVTATNSEGYTSTSYATFIALANPPVLVNQAVNAPVGATTNVPFNYSGTYPADLTTEQIVSPPSHGTATIQPNGSINYTNDDSLNATDSFQFSVSDTASNPSNVETVNINVTDGNAPMITTVTPPGDGTGSYAYQSTVDANYSCSDLVPGGVISCSATQDVNGNTVSVPDGSPIDTSSLIVGDIHCLTITAVNFFDLTTTSTPCYTVNTPAPVTNDDSATTINPNPVTVPVLNNDTTNFPFNPSTVTVVSNPTYGTTTVEPNGSIKYIPTSASTTSVTNDSFGYTVKDTDGQVSNESTVHITVFPVPGVGGVSPIAGPLTQGTPVVISGYGFATATAVNFGSTPASSFTIVNNTTIDAVAPAAPDGVPGSANVTVTSSGGTTPVSAANLYTWDPVPTLTSVSPTTGIVAGGQTLTVNGTGFASGTQGATTVTLRKSGGGASSACTNVSVNAGGTQLTCTTGASTASGLFDVLVSTPGGATPAIPADQYTYYFPAPSITTVSPSSGVPGGGTSVTITGNSFSGATGVSFGANQSSAFTVNSNTSITATSPAGTAGSRVDITVTGPGGTSTTLPADQFTYGPQVTGLSPSTGPAAGGTTVTITGSGLSNASSVSFGGAVGSVISNTDTSITTVAPAGTGTVDVQVTTPNGVSPVSSSDRFTYSSPQPSVSGITPNSGPVTGGTAVTISGNGFTGATTVSFGGNPGVINSVAGNSIVATSPAGVTGPVDVTVTTPGGTSPTSSLDKFNYGPFISSIAPATGSTSGGTTVTITGTGLSGASSVNFGSGVAAPTSSTATSITVVTPPGAAGAVAVSTTVGGIPSNVKNGGFTYTTAAPTVTSISPTSGPTAGGTVVTITGNGFTGATAVDFGGVAATGVSVNGAGTSVTATSPAGTAGSTVAVTVTTPGGTSASVANGQFTYGATVGHLSPTSGLITGGTTVTITGTGFTGATAVNFGATPGTNLVVNSATSISVKSPAHAVGPVDVTVVVGGVASPTSPNDVFTFQYPVPVVGSMTPNVGKSAGGDTVTITGSGFTGATTVSFGANPATIVTNTGTTLTVTSPAGTAKAIVDVTVTGPGGTSALTSSDKFTYGPVVTSLSPNTGSHAGGTTVTVKGAGFTGATAVNFGGVAVTTGITVNATGTQLTVKAPAGAAGSVDVTVTAGGITSNTGSADLFTYV
jgi:IPT/TIG domain